MSILVAASLLCTVLGCANPTDPAPAPPDLTITTTGDCARISFQITGSSSVTTWYASAACTVGLVVIRSAGASTWNGGTRTLTLKLRVANTSTEPVTLPVRLELPVDGKTVTLPEGISPDSLVPLDMDSTLAGDRKLCLVGRTGTLAPGDSSETKTLTFQVKEPVTKGRFWFVSSGEAVPSVPAVAPDSMPSWLRSDTAYTTGIAKNALLVEFDPGATVTEKAAAIDSVNGIVVGGKQYSSTDFAYVIWIPAPNLDSLFAAIDILARQPKVVRADGIARARELGRRARTGTLAPEDSSETRTLTFQVKEPVTKRRLWFVSSGEEIPTLPAVAPDSMPGWLGSDSAYTGGIAKNALAVEFDPAATVSEKTAAIDSVSGVVVGGVQFSGGTNGPYILWVPAASVDSLFAAIDILERQPKVVSANVIARARGFGRRPRTGTLVPRDSPETRALTFQAKEPVTKGRFWFVSSGEGVPTVPAVAPV